MLEHAEDGVADASAPLPHLDRIQAAFGRHDVREVRASVGGKGGEAASDLAARAYIFGERAAFHEQPNLLLAAHEAAHIVQQRRGVVAGGIGSSDEPHEREADSVARAVVAGSSVEAMLGPVSASAVTEPALQRDEDPDAADLAPWSNIEMLPTREDYERQGRLRPKNDPGAALISMSDLASGQKIELVGALGSASASGEKLDLGAFGHPHPVPESTGSDVGVLAPDERIMRLAALEVAVANLGKMIGDDTTVGARLFVASSTLSAMSALIRNPDALVFYGDIDLTPNAAPPTPDQIPPSDAAAQSREIVRTEAVYERLFGAFAELAQQTKQEEVVGGQIADTSHQHAGTPYDLEYALSILHDVRAQYVAAAVQVLQPRIIRTFNAADVRHGEVISELVHAKLSYYEAIKSSSKGGQPIASEVSSWAYDIDADVQWLENEAPKLRAEREAGTLTPERATAFNERAALVAASIEALGEYDLVLGAHDQLADKGAAWGWEDLRRVRWRVEQMREAARAGDVDYLNVLLEDHRKDPQVLQFYASIKDIPSFWKFLVTFAIAVIASVASAGAGILVGAMFAAAEGWVMVTIGFIVRTGVEALVFTLIDRTLSSAVGLAPTTPFWKDFLWNWGLFAALHGAGKLMGPALKTMSGLEKFVVSHGVSFGILQTYGFIRGSVEAGRLLTADEVMSMTAQNLGMMVGMGLAMKGFQPMLGGLENHLSLRQFRAKYAGDFEYIEAQRQDLLKRTQERLEAKPDAGPDDVKDLEADAKALDTELKDLLDTIANDPLMQNAAVRAEAASLFDGIARKSVPEVLRELGLDPRADLLAGGRDGQYSYARGSATEVKASLDAAGLPYTSTRTGSGTVLEVDVPGKGRIDLIERPSEQRIDAPLTEGELATARTRIAEDASAGGTRSPEAYKLADKPAQTAGSVAKVARGLAQGLAGEGIHLQGVKADAAPKGGPAATQVRGTLEVQPGIPLADIKVPVSIEVVPDLRTAVDTTAHGEDTGHASFKILPDGKGSWRVEIKIDARLASKGDVAHHLRHELREANDILRELARDPSYNIDAAQRQSTFEDPAKATAHDRAAAAEFRDLATELGKTIEKGDEARKRVADRKGGRASDRAAAARGAEARARVDAMLESMGLSDPATRAAKIETIRQLLGIDASSPLAKYLDSYARRTDAAVARRAALDRLDAPTKTAVEKLMGDYADVVPERSIRDLADLVAAGGDTRNAANLIRERVGGSVSEPHLVQALAEEAKNARSAAIDAAERGEAPGRKRVYKATDPAEHRIQTEGRGRGLSKQQDDAFRQQIEQAEEYERQAMLEGKTPEKEKTALWKRYQRYLARIANAATPETPMDFEQWKDKNPQIVRATSRGRDIEIRAIRAAGATVSNNAAGQYKTVKYFDEKTNRVITARADATLGEIPVESKYISPESRERVVYDTTQTRAERSQHPQKKHLMVLSTDVPPGTEPTVTPSRILRERSTVLFYDPAKDAITFEWSKEEDRWIKIEGAK
jgi:hypothetical protein